MDKILINGGKPLNGSVQVSGSKNAALPILFSTILVEDTCIIENLPNISDVTDAFDILKAMGAFVKIHDGSIVEINTKNLRCGTAPYELVRNMRASYYILGSELGRFGRSTAAYPGGDDFGVRPIDQHIKGFEALGATVEINNGSINCETENGLNGSTVYMDKRSVGATINIILAAVKAEGKTIIENANKEPHIVDLVNFLNSCGAEITGAGTDIIKIRGVSHLHGVSYDIIPDMIEAGTFMAGAAATSSVLRINNIIPKHLDSITAKLREMGIIIVEGDDYLIIDGRGPKTRVKVNTLPYPGFPTDMNPQMGALLCLAKGTSIITEGVFDNRFRYTEELNRMGASIKVDGKFAIIEGVDNLKNANVKAYDIRAGVALVIAGLAAEGETIINEIYHIERGYERLVEKLCECGADIKYVRANERNAASL